MTDPLHADLRSEIDGFLHEHFVDGPIDPAGQKRLHRSMLYSLMQKGSKRFRPLLSLLVAEALEAPWQRILPFAAAVEMIHTYSLIHDDLPAMDDDDFRRGEPTNHRAFDEATAILAGDALLTEAFAVIAKHYAGEPHLAVQLIAELAQASGRFGMVGGQAIDLAAQDGQQQTGSQLEHLHRLKTGALIRVSARGAAIIAGAKADQLLQVTEYAEGLGLAFQIADDILDYDVENVEAGSYPAVMGLEPSRAHLSKITELTIANLSGWPERAEALRRLAAFNHQRCQVPQAET